MNQCPACGIPLDAGLFDASGCFRIVTEKPDTSGQQASLMPGDELELACFELQPQHSGMLLYFCQFTDHYAADPCQVQTPGYSWEIRSGGYTLAPWLQFRCILNPWGMSAFPLHLKIQEGTRLSFVIRNNGVLPTDGVNWLNMVGGRIVGRYWFDLEHVPEPELGKRCSK